MLCFSTIDQNSSEWSQKLTSDFTRLCVALINITHIRCCIPHVSLTQYVQYFDFTEDILSKLSENAQNPWIDSQSIKMYKMRFNSRITFHFIEHVGFTHGTRISLNQPSTNTRRMKCMTTVQTADYLSGFMHDYDRKPTLYSLNSSRQTGHFSLSCTSSMRWQTSITETPFRRSINACFVWWLLIDWLII